MGQYNEGNFGVTYPTGISLFVTNDLIIRQEVGTDLVGSFYLIQKRQE